MREPCGARFVSENQAVSRVAAFVRLTRPQFLLGGALLYAVGAVHAGEVEVGGYLLGQGLVTAAQVTAHYVNEYADVEADRRVVNRTLFSGGSGVLAAGALAPSVALIVASVTSAATVGLAIWLSFTSPVAALLGLLALAGSWAYSMPPVRLLDTGWGELVTSLVVAGLVPLMGVTANGGAMTGELGWAIAMLVTIHFAMMLAFAIPDLETDQAAGKTPLAVRLGLDATRRALATIVAVSGLIAVAGLAIGVITEPLPVLLALVPAGVLVLSAWGERPWLLTTSAVLSVVGVALASLAQI